MLGGEKWRLSYRREPFTYKVDNINLLCVRPQYSNRAYNNIWQKYNGPHFNSSLHISSDVGQLMRLITRGAVESKTSLKGGGL